MLNGLDFEPSVLHKSYLEPDANFFVPFGSKLETTCKKKMGLNSATAVNNIQYLKTIFQCLYFKLSVFTVYCVSCSWNHSVLLMKANLMQTKQLIYRDKIFLYMCSGNFICIFKLTPLEILTQDSVFLFGSSQMTSVVFGRDKSCVSLISLLLLCQTQELPFHQYARKGMKCLKALMLV